MLVLLVLMLRVVVGLLLLIIFLLSLALAASVLEGSWCCWLLVFFLCPLWRHPVAALNPSCALDLIQRSNVPVGGQTGVRNAAEFQTGRIQAVTCQQQGVGERLIQCSWDGDDGGRDAKQSSLGGRRTAGRQEWVQGGQGWG